MVNMLKQEAKAHGDRLQVIPVERLQDLKDGIAKFKSEYELNSFQQWIVNDMYQLSVPESDFPIRSILLLALPHPPYAKVEFYRAGTRYQFLSLVMSDLNHAKHYLKNLLEPEGYHILPAGELPMKRLAASCGLAEYGRNNICYVEGMGSNFLFDAYYSDLPAEDIPWSMPKLSATCNGCSICIKACPTGAIRKDVFLIDNERCLSALNEMPNPFPEWLPSSVHHTLYDCLRCQEGCPMNRGYQESHIGSVIFDEEETNAILAGNTYDSFDSSLKEKSDLLGMTQWLAAIPRNLRILMDNYNEQV